MWIEYLRVQGSIIESINSVYLNMNFVLLQAIPYIRIDGADRGRFMEIPCLIILYIVACSANAFI